MGLADRLNQLTKKAKETAAEHKDQVEQAIGKAAANADQRTGGRYHDKIAKAEAKAEEYVQNLEPANEDAAGERASAQRESPDAGAGSEHEPRPRA